MVRVVVRIAIRIIIIIARFARILIGSYAEAYSSRLRKASGVRAATLHYVANTMVPVVVVTMRGCSTAALGSLEYGCLQFRSKLEPSYFVKGYVYLHMRIPGFRGGAR